MILLSEQILDTFGTRVEGAMFIKTKKCLIHLSV